MYRKNYKVKGEDVDDFMVMQDVAYHNYTSSLLNAFLLEKGYSKRKREMLKIDLQESIESLIFRKHLMFTQVFFVNLELLDVDYKEWKLTFRNRFFNANNELCVTANTKLYWFDNAQQEIIKPPKKIIDRLLN
ncbi:thioesterase family protein [uncultured Aquimarina sp.]|uniref:thioesterase family protein n=1 Tax=uncultured Aquimarina sp. TaxID=575652 RepID=UPI00261E4C96|nr:thioesterase family protein [uncultured Aquimarina sp.]